MADRDDGVRAGTPLVVLGMLVPRADRAAWRREWAAEFAHTRPAAMVRFRRLLDAAEDALRCRLRHFAMSRADGGARSLAEDARFAWRALSRRPAYAAAAVAALALAIGANTAIFSVVSGVLFHRLPYQNPDELVIVWSDGSARGLGIIAGTSPPDILDWRREAKTLTEIGALLNTSKGLTDLEEPVVPLTHAVTGNYFGILGVEAALGRTILPEDEDGRRVVVISHTLWRDAFGSREDIVGSTVRLDDEEWQIVGVMKPDFFSVHQLPTQPDLWIPMALRDMGENRSDRRYAAYGRLAPGSGLDDARREFRTIAARFEERFPDSHVGWSSTVVPIAEHVLGPFRGTLALLLAAVGLVLAVACANVANLSLAQTSSRLREMAVRAALGAPAFRLRRQLLLEGLMLSLAGGLIGTAGAALALPVLLRLLPGGGGSVTLTGAGAVPFVEHVSIDLRVLAFSVGVSVIAGLAGGMLPARHARRVDLDAALRDGSRGVAGGHGRARALLVVAETAVAVLLVAGAGMLLTSFRNLERLGVGFDADQVVTIRNSLRGQEFGDAGAWVNWFETTRTTLGALPDIESAAAVSFVPPEFANSSMTFTLSGRDLGSPGQMIVRIVTPGYFETMGIPIRAGRPIDDTDRADGAAVAVVNEEFRRRYLGEDPLAGSILPDLTGVAAQVLGPTPELQIVGVVGDVRAAGPDPAPHPMVYVPHAQAPRPVMNLVIRTGAETGSIGARVERELWAISRSINLYSLERLDVRLGNLQWQALLSLRLLLAFGAVTLVLGAAGLYAVLAFSISRRVREMGIRMALGAEAATVRRMVIGEGLKLTAAGIVVGALGSLMVGRLLAGMLYEVAPTDPAVLGLTALLLLATGVGACAIPAVRATRVDPATALQPD